MAESLGDNEEHASLEEVLVRRITSRGRITFAEFMELALYWPKGGYYATPRSGLAPHYFTAPQAHPAFGALLALQLEEMWERLGSPRPFTVVEPGAGPGRLAKDIMSYASHLDTSFAQALHYVTVDRSMAAAIVGRAPPLKSVAAIGFPFRGVVGCVLSNELLDALPVHRVVMRQGRLKELFVTWRDGRFLEVEDEPSTPKIVARMSKEGVALQERQRAEVCLALDDWIREVAGAVEAGFLLIIDYGYTAEELYSSRRLGGTLRCYYRHTVSANPFVRVGEQDMTAHVDFTAVALLGAEYGLSVQTFQTQASFLRNLGLEAFRRRLLTLGLGQRERDANGMALLELARPGGMGDFKVMVLSKDVDASSLSGVLGADPEWQKRLEGLPLPLLDAGHLPLMEARYPHAVQEADRLWR